MRRPTTKTGDLSAKQAHIAQLVEDKGLTVEYVEEEKDCQSARFQSKIKIEPVECDVSYLIALHEIGHCHTAFPFFTKLENERLAWDWAMDNSQEPVSQEAWAYGLSVLNNWMCDQAIENVMTDEGSLPDDDFWETLGRLSWRAGEHADEAIPMPEKILAVTALYALPGFAEQCREEWQKQQAEKEAA